MKISNPFRMNDWGIRKFLTFALLAQIIGIATIGWEMIGIPIPILRQAFFFINLTFIPGFAILRILRIHDHGSIETFLFSVGLSLSTVMSIALFANLVLPSFGINKPISFLPLTAALFLVNCTLCAVCYLRDRDHTSSPSTNLRDVILSPGVLAISLVPIVIVGAVLFNLGEQNSVTLLVLLLISGITFVLGFSSLEMKKWHPVFVWIASITLLYSSSLVSMHLGGWDIQHEYYLSHRVLTNSHWNHGEYGTTNGMLSIVLLAPTYSVLLDIDLTWVFKILFPLLYSLVPVGLYCLYRRFVDANIAVLAAFFFMSLYSFFADMTQLGRQEIAEIFLVLIMLALFSERTSRFNRSVLLIVFSYSMVVSHYGTAYFFAICLGGVWALQRFNSARIRENQQEFVSGRFVAIFLVMTLTWYTYVSGGASFNKAAWLGDLIWTSFFKDLLNPEVNQGLSTAIAQPATLLHSVAKFLNIAAMALIVIGFLSLVSNRRFRARHFAYVTFAAVNLIFLAAGMVVPYLTGSFNVSRYYHLGLLLLAPSLPIGTITMCRFLSSRTSSDHRPMLSKSSRLTVVASVLVAFLMIFNTGVAYELASDVSTSISLDPHIDGPIFNDMEVQCIDMLVEVKDGRHVSADLYRWLLVGSRDWGTAYILNHEEYENPGNWYLFLGTINTRQHTVLVGNDTNPYDKGVYLPTDTLLTESSRVFDNGGAQVIVPRLKY